MEAIRKNLWTVVVAAILAVVLIIYLFSFQVPAGYAGVLLTFGDFSETASEPGLHFKWPTPIQEVRLLDTRTRLFESKSQESQTKDKINLNILLSMGWHITDPEKFVRKLGSRPEDAEEKLLNRVDSVRNKTLGEYTLYDLVNTNFDQQQQTFSEFEARMAERLTRDLEVADWGLEVTFLGVQQMAFPEETTNAVFERMKKERAVESDKLMAEGQSKAKIIVSEAERESKTAIAEARAEAQIIRGEGDAAAAEHYQVFKENPELANYLRSLRTLENVLTGRSTVLLSTENQPFGLLDSDAPKIEIQGK